MEVDDVGDARDRGAGHARGGLGGARDRSRPRALAAGARARHPRRARRGAPQARVVVGRRAPARAARRVPDRGGHRAVPGHARDRHREHARLAAARDARRELPAGGRLSASEPAREGARPREDVGEVFAALADPTRRLMLQELLRAGTTSVPALSAVLPITRQAVAKHLTTLDHAGLVERAPAHGREVRYRLRAGALEPASQWLAGAEAAWGRRLTRLKDAV